MHHWIKIIAAVFVLLCVLTIFIAPSVDLPDTAMRGGKSLALAILAFGAMLIFAWLPSLLFALSRPSAAPLLVVDPDRIRSQRIC